MSREKYRNLLEAWPDALTDGIFTKLQEKEVPWKSENLSMELNLGYYYNHSGKKIVSNLVEHQVNADGILTADAKQKITDLVYTVNKENWERTWKALIESQYSPIENVDGYISTEKSHDNTGVQSGTNNKAHTGTDTHTNGGTDNVQYTGSDSIKDSGTDNHSFDGSDSVTTNESADFNDTLKITNKTENDMKVYHHAFTTEHNDKHHGNDSTVTTENKTAGYNSDKYTPSTQQIVTSDTAVINRTTNGKENEAGSLTDEEKAWNNSDITDDDRILTEQHEGGNNTSTDETSTTTYGKKDNETVDLTKETTYGHSENRTLDTTNTDNYNSNEDVTLNITNTDNGKEKEETHRHGNIGVTTNQQMIEEELNLRTAKKSFYELVFADIDRYLTIPIY